MNNSKGLLFSFIILAENQSVDRSKAAETQEQESGQVHVKLRLIEEVNILQQDTTRKRSTVSGWENVIRGNKYLKTVRRGKRHSDNTL